MEFSQNDKDLGDFTGSDNLAILSTATAERSNSHERISEQRDRSERRRASPDLDLAPQNTNFTPHVPSIYDVGDLSFENELSEFLKYGVGEIWVPSENDPCWSSGL